MKQILSSDVLMLLLVRIARSPPPSRTEIPSSLESDEYELYQDSFTLDAPEGQRKDMNTEDKVRRVEEVFRVYKEKLEERYIGRKKGNGSREGKDVEVGLGEKWKI